MKLPVSTVLEIATRRAKGAAGEVRRQTRKRYRSAPSLVQELLSLTDSEARSKIRLSRGRFHSGPLVRALVEVAARTTPLDATEGLRIAELATEVLRQIPDRMRRRHRSCYWQDLGAAICAEQGNALRVLNRRKEARQVFGTAVILFESGSCDELLHARLASLMGSHFFARGRIKAAGRAFTIASDLYRKQGANSRLGEVQLNQAGLLDFQGCAEGAIELQIEALSNLDEDSEPITFLAAHTNLADMMYRQGKAKQALGVIDSTEFLIKNLDDCPALGIWHWVRGRCCIASANGLGEVDLLAAWRILRASGNSSDLGLVGLDLAKLYLGSRRYKDLERIAEPTVAAFSRQPLNIEAARMLLDFRTTVEEVVLLSDGLVLIVENLTKLLEDRRSLEIPSTLN